MASPVPEGGDNREASPASGLTDGGRSGESSSKRGPARRIGERVSTSVKTEQTEAMDWQEVENAIKLEEATEAERSPGWEAVEAKVLVLMQDFRTASRHKVFSSYWKEPEEEQPRECRVVRSGMEDRDRTKGLAVYFPDGEACYTSIIHWKWARIRAELVRRTGRVATISFPWLWRTAIDSILAEEHQKTGESLPFGNGRSCF